MLIDTGYEGPLNGVGAHAQNCERSEEISGLWLTDTTNDPFLLCQLALAATEKIQVGTNIAVAFARSPYIVAQTAWNLAALSQGRFCLGLGPQVRAHITKRFSAQWPTKPAQAMGEYLDLLRHLFARFRDRQRPSFKGEHFRCTLNSPVFTPDPHDLPDPKIGISAVGPLMTKLAGAKADTIFLHPFTHLEYLNGVTLPNLKTGAADRSEELEPLELVGSSFLIATDLPNRKQATQKVIERLAFYASTPNYKGVLETLGLGGVHEKLHQLSRQGKWQEMGAGLPPELIEACVIQGPRAELKGLLNERFGKIYDRIVVDGSQLTDLVVHG